MTVIAISHRAPTPIDAWDTDEQRIIREQVAGGMSPPITDPELAYFAQVCRSRGLNPIAGQIVPVRRQGRLVIQVTIHGLRAIADATGCYAPGPLTTFVTDGDGRLVCATASVLKYVQSAWHVVSEVAYFDEYCEYTLDRQTGERRPQALWATKPRVMIAKCAEALALRRAFPVQLGGLYEPAELAQADGDDQSVPVRPPARPTVTATPAAPLSSTPGERPDFTGFWRDVKAGGWDTDTITTVAQQIYQQPVSQLNAAELRELRDAAVNALLAVGSDGTWRIQAIGGESARVTEAE